MSSFKNASKVNQKVHRERHQPADRSHLGLLEKKKDYKFRADDYNKKKKVIKHLRNAALDRNPDEFYFHMINSEKREGVHFEKKKPDSEATVQQKKLLENKTLNYVAMKRVVEEKKIQKMHSEMHLVDAVGQFKRNHIRFDDGEQAECSSNSVVALGLNNSSLNDYTLNKLMRQKVERYQELSRRIHRKKELTVIQQKMEIAQALKNGRSTTRPKLVKQETKKTAAVYQWKYERKR
ncbi:hypothetical protein GE061_015955 [Apolygus lucorum]|uniref:U3 small nucleolar RNA-associated protein 11 n=1 Tax=Apolygus lucorum TaxID=248454 RepID=A0A8S9XG21_APOLU|nr:hypothetical protein GE061_015955 [Apolygus lucorum]